MRIKFFLIVIFVLYPMPVLAATLAAGGAHALVMNDDGTVMAWGYNGKGQLGDGSLKRSSSPVMVKGLLEVTAVAAGFNSSMALRKDGTVWAWGANTYGQLGDGTKEDKTEPVQVKGLIGVTSIAAGDMFSLAVKGDDSLWAWGRNNFGQLDDGTLDNRTSPVRVVGVGGHGFLNLRQASNDQVRKDMLPPVYFGATPESGTAPLNVQYKPVFTPGKAPKKLEWDFDDGDISTENTPSHIYETPGTYIVTMTASYGNNIYRESMKKIEVKAAW